MNEQYIFDWSDLAFANKKPLKNLKATFISAPREISSKRFTQLVKEYLPTSNIVIGIAKEDYIDGFEGQPQFRTLNYKTIKNVVEKVNNSPSPYKIYVITYFQREWLSVISKLSFARVLMINGSWKYVFHNSPIYYLLAKEKISYRLLSPFCDESEAHSYEKRIKKELKDSLQSMPDTGKTFTDTQMLESANQAARMSFDYSFQTGAALGLKNSGSKKYILLVTAHNVIVPFETYALHNGASRETNFSPANDLNHYDAVHAEVELVVRALRNGYKLTRTTLFINLLPCPTCARMLCETDIAEIVYQKDHSDGYAVKLLEEAGKKVRRIVI